MTYKLHNVSLPASITLLVSLFSCLVGNLHAQLPKADEQALDVDALVRQVIYNEIEAQLNDHSLWCYRQQHEEDAKPVKTLEVCQTQDGDVERLVALDGRDLNLTEQLAEDERIHKLISAPEQIRAKQKKDRDDAEQARKLFKAFPEAFRFQYERQSGTLITLQFRPNPAFHPSTRASLVFHHMEGQLVLDARQKRLVEVQGRLISEVKFGGGLLGRLDKNGTFVVKQQEVAPGHWDQIFMSVHMNGKALFFKSIDVLQKKSFTDFKPFPQGASLRQAADFLKNDFDVRSASSSGK